MQKILLKQTDSEIHFAWCKQKTKMLVKTTYIQASRFVFITPASFEVPQVIR